MGYEVGYDSNWKRDIGYGVPSVCDHPDCNEEIDRGLGYVCGGGLYGTPDGCGLFFCEDHGGGSLCERCESGDDERGFFKPKPDTNEWVEHKNTHPSWSKWREQQKKKKERSK